MKFAKTMKSVLSGILAGALVLSSTASMSFPVIESEAASLCTINTDKLYQRIRGFGGINLPEWVGSDMTSAQVQKAFGNGPDELGLTILRIYVSDDSNAWSRAVPTAKAAQALGATVFASPWNPPASMRVSGGSNGKYAVDKNKYADYAKHLNSYIKYMEGQGIDLYSVSVQNEPDYAHDWTYWSPSDLTTFLANYGKTVTEGTNAKMMSPESFQYRKDMYNAILNNSQAFANTDLFGTHFYGTQRSQMDYPALENSGKEIWMTEVYVPNSEANSADRWPEAVQVAENIHNGLVVGNMNAYVWWYIRRQYSPMKEDGQISKRGYCMAQYSKFVRPGDARIEATEQPASNVLVSAYKHSDTQITVVAVNKGSSDETQQFSVNGRTITDVDRYRTTGSENLALTENMEHDTSTYWANLPANSVSTFVITLESDGKELPEYSGTPEPPKALEPDANGYYYHDTFEKGSDDWTGRGAASVTLSGAAPYQGTNALLVQDRTSAWHGAQKSLNTLTFKAGESYSFSACVNYTDGAETQDFLLSLQYTLNGETMYDHIAEATATKGSYVQLANTSYTIPAGATNPILYIETADGTGNFYIDEAIVAVDGTVIPGPKAVKIIKGDITFDGVINAFDIAAGKKGLAKGFANNNAAKAADVNESGEPEVVDVVAITKFVLGQIKKFDVVEKPTEAPTEAPTQAPTEARREGYFYNTADVSWIDPSKPMVALSFDDGPISGGETSYAGRIQTAISKAGGHSTFFYWGSRIAGNESEIKRAQSLGFEIANHTWSHPNLTEKSAWEIQNEVKSCADKLTEITGLTDFLLRPPYLGVDDKVRQNVGTAMVCCAIDSSDWSGATAQQMIDKITAAANNGTLNGKVILMHETYDSTAQAVEYLAPYLTSKGYQLVTVSEMFKAKGIDMKIGEVYNNLP